jgi:hypothetical protein
MSHLTKKTTSTPPTEASHSIHKKRLAASVCSPIAPLAPRIHWDLKSVTGTTSGNSEVTTGMLDSKLDVLPLCVFKQLFTSGTLLFSRGSF